MKNPPWSHSTVTTEATLAASTSYFFSSILSFRFKRRTVCVDLIIFHLAIMYGQIHLKEWEEVTTVQGLSWLRMDLWGVTTVCTTLSILTFCLFSTVGLMNC